MTTTLNIKNLPKEFISRLEVIFPEKHLDSVLKSFIQSKKTVFRCNGLKTTTAQLSELLFQSGIRCIPLDEVTGAFLVPEDQRRALTESKAFRDGHLYIQNPSSMIPPIILDPKP